MIRNIGLLLSGAMEKPILDADTIVAENGKITAIGRAKDIDTEGATTLIDANGTTVAPGLIDSHVHPVAGDWTPRQNQINWIDSYLHGGVTTMISAGEVHMPGRPRDVVGLKAMAIFAQRSFWTLRPGGVKVHAGAPVIETEMVEEDFKELAAAGVKLLGEVGLGGVKDGPTARKMVGWARKYGIQSTIHTGGPSIPGSGLIDKDVVLEADTDVVGHINGGHTALPDDQIRCICEGCKRGLELVHNGNERSALYTLRTAQEMGDLSRIILGTDAPAGSGVQPLGILRMVSLLSSLGEVPAEIAFCFATGNTARMRALDCGLIEIGRSADLEWAQQSRRPHPCVWVAKQNAIWPEPLRPSEDNGDTIRELRAGARGSRPYEDDPAEVAQRPIAPQYAACTAPSARCRCGQEFEAAACSPGCGGSGRTRSGEGWCGRPLMWPTTLVSASSATSLSIRPEPGIEPPCGSCSGCRICAPIPPSCARWARLTPPRPTSPSSLTPAAASSLKSSSTISVSMTGRAGVNLHAAGTQGPERRWRRSPSP